MQLAEDAERRCSRGWRLFVQIVRGLGSGTTTFVDVLAPLADESASPTTRKWRAYTQPSLAHHLLAA
jgi:hypothetical protein